METTDRVCEMLIRRLYEARDHHQCQLSFERFLDDIRDRLELLDDPTLWDKYENYLNETFSPVTSPCNPRKP